MASFHRGMGHLLFGGSRTAAAVSDLYDRLLRSKRFRAFGEENLEIRLQRLEEAAAEEALLYQALFRACLDRGLISVPEFLSLLKKVDLLDGEADGRLARRKPKKKPAGKDAAP
jgi:hypothetical protein